MRSSLLKPHLRYHWLAPIVSGARSTRCSRARPRPEAGDGPSLAVGTRCSAGPTAVRESRASAACDRARACQACASSSVPALASAATTTSLAIFYSQTLSQVREQLLIRGRPRLAVVSPEIDSRVGEHLTKESGGQRHVLRRRRRDERLVHELGEH